MGNIDLRKFGKTGRFQCTFLYRCTQCCSSTGYSTTTTTRAIFSSFALVLSSLVPCRPRSLSHFLPFLPARELPPRTCGSSIVFRIFPSSIRENFPIEDLPIASAIGFLSSCCSGNDSIPKHSSWEKEEERERKEGESAIYQSRPLWLSSRDRLRFHARIQQEFPAIRDALLFPICESFRCVSYSATNCRCDGTFK